MLGGAFNKRTRGGEKTKGTYRRLMLVQIFAAVSLTARAHNMLSRRNLFILLTTTRDR